MGPQDIIIVGNKSYRQQVFSQLQMLTSEKLFLTEKGAIQVAGTPGGGAKPVGTELVSKLIKSEHKIIIEDKGVGNRTSFNDMSAAAG
ncbi:hypothetical protein, partial [Pedobacter sp. HMWF019]|uniref:hypothetical protein n=1 Tax=Pedobacter sp. HMWF019 TaxID=2056856 RepID=UPI001E4FDA8F